MKINSILMICLCTLQACNYHLESNNGSATHSSNASACNIAFYNTENLFDTIDDPRTQDNDFLPGGKLKWNTSRYIQKLARVHEIIDALEAKAALAMIGLAEVENKTVLEDLIKADKSFKIIHYNSSDKRGIDVCMVYNESLFHPLTSYLCRFKKEDDPELFMREVLLVKGILIRDTVHVLVNHWPSRREGEMKTEKKRIAAAMLTQEIIDSIFSSNKKSKLIVMGDFNDEPDNESMKVMLNIQSENDASTSSLSNPFMQLKAEGKGTCRYKRDWFLFDQILISNSLMQKKGLQFVQASVFDPQWLYYRKDLASGPFRTYVGDKYYGGYSDHFPVYIELKK